MASSVTLSEKSEAFAWREEEIKRAEQQAIQSLARDFARIAKESLDEEHSLIEALPVYTAAGMFEAWKQNARAIKTLQKEVTAARNVQKEIGGMMSFAIEQKEERIEGLIFEFSPLLHLEPSILENIIGYLDEASVVALAEDLEEMEDTCLFDTALIRLDEIRSSQHNNAMHLKPLKIKNPQRRGRRKRSKKKKKTKKQMKDMEETKELLEKEYALFRSKMFAQASQMSAAIEAAAADHYDFDFKKEQQQLQTPQSVVKTEEKKCSQDRVENKCPLNTISSFNGLFKLAADDHVFVRLSRQAPIRGQPNLLWEGFLPFTFLDDSAGPSHCQIVYGLDPAEESDSDLEDGYSSDDYTVGSASTMSSSGDEENRDIDDSVSEDPCPIEARRIAPGSSFTGISKNMLKIDISPLFQNRNLQSIWPELQKTQESRCSAQSESSDSQKAQCVSHLVSLAMNLQATVVFATNSVLEGEVQFADDDPYCDCFHEMYGSDFNLKYSEYYDDYTRFLVSTGGCAGKDERLVQVSLQSRHGNDNHGTAKIEEDNEVQVKIVMDPVASGPVNLVLARAPW